MNFYDMLDNLESLSGSSDKEDYLIHILTRVKNAEAFFKFTFNEDKYGVQEKTFKNIYGPHLHNHISDYLETLEVNYNSEMKIPDLINFGRILLNNSGYAQQEQIQKFFKLLNGQKKKWFCRAILKDLRCGIQVTTLNKAFKACGMKPIEKYAVMLCQKVDLYNDKDVKKKLTFPCSMECKYDGIRVQAEIWVIDKKIETLGIIEAPVYEMGCILTSRRGTDKTQDYPELVKELKTTFAGENIILDGEVISSSFQELTRKDSKSSKNYVVFDLLVDELLPYKDRWSNLYSLLMDKGITEYNLDNINKINNNHIYFAEHYSCNSLKEAQEYYEDLNARGEEGIIIKLDDKPYFRSTKKKALMPMYKCKKVFDADLKCVGYKLGTGKRSGKVSTLCLVDASRTIEVDVGAGIDDYHSELFTEQINSPGPDFIGSIIEIQYNEITETGSLRFPRFIKIREDKTEPDDLSKEKVRQG